MPSRKVLRSKGIPPVPSPPFSSLLFPPLPSPSLPSPLLSQKFTILPEDLSPFINTLTPTLKMERKVVAQKYAAAIETMYEEATKL